MALNVTNQSETSEFLIQTQHLGVNQRLCVFRPRNKSTRKRCGVTGRKYQFVYTSYTKRRLL